MKDKEKYAYNYLIAKGLSPIHAAGIVGNLKAESNFITDIKGTADDKGSVGLAQWHSERKKGLYDFANKTNRPWDNIDVQLDYVLHELNTTHKNSFEKLKKTTTADEAALVFMNSYERPAEWAKKQSAKSRVNTAREVSGLEIDPNFKYEASPRQTETVPERGYISAIDFNAPATSGITFGAEEKEDKVTEQPEMTSEQASKELMEDSFIEELQKNFEQASQYQTPQEQPQYQEEPFTYNVELQPIQYVPTQQFQQGGIIRDQQGQRKYPNQITEIQGNIMATDGYGDIPLYVVPDTGEPKIIFPNTGEHIFKGATKFTEYPIFK